MCLGANAYAGKPLIAVLGLEVVDPGGTPTPQDTQVAKALTDGLRSRAKAGTGPFQIAGNSDKELIDEKLLKNCDSEAPTCMASIGSDLGADVLMYGKIERKGTAYYVTVKLLDVHRKLVQKTLPNESIPLSQTKDDAELQRWAKTIYAKLTGQNTAGQVLVKLQNGDHGTILINGDEKGSITNGVGQVSTLEEGKYRLEVQSEGFKPWSDTIMVRPGETTNVPVKLERADGGTRIITPPPGGGGEIGPGGGPGGGGMGIEGGGGRGNTTWKGVFVGSVVVGLAGGGIILYGRNQINDARSQLCTGGAYNPDMPDAQHMVIDATCNHPSNSPSPLTDAQVKSLNDKGDRGKVMTWVGGVTAGVAGAFAIVALYKGFIAKDGGSSGERVVQGHRVHRDRFVVTPIVSPDGGGATLRFDW
ncbi:MAG: PEGA domain-containing protein [Acidobacteriota bacterium]